MDFKDDKLTWNINDEFMFGRSLLVAPVTHALYTREAREFTEEAVDWSGARTMGVYLPARTKWYDWWTGKMYVGGKSVEADASLDRCPLYVRAGSIIPIGPDVQYASEKAWDYIEVRVYTGADGRFTLYEDEGDNRNYEKGAYSTIEFTLKGRTLTIGERKGSYKGMLQKKHLHINVISADGQKDLYVSYNGEETKINL